MRSRDGMRPARSAPGLLVLVAFLLLVPTVGAFAKDDKKARKSAAPKTWHTKAFIRGDSGVSVIHYWSKGPAMRAETVIRGRPVTTLVDSNRYVVFEGTSRLGIDVGRSAQAIAADRGRIRPFAFELEEIKGAGGEKVEDLRLGSMEAEIWQVTDGQGKRKVWIASGEHQVPVRAHTFDRRTGATVEIDYSGWVFDLELPDAFFEPPPGLELERFEYETYRARSLEGPVSPVPILYPDLLHGLPL